MGSCPVSAGSEDTSTRGSGWTGLVYASFICTILTVISSTILIITHLRRYRVPAQQRQIIRIVFSLIIYTFVAFGELYDYSVAQYVDPIGDVYESFGLCALLLLFMQYAAPSSRMDDDTFALVKSAEDSETGFDWPRIYWILVFQYPIFEVASTIIVETTEATGHYCVNSLNPIYAHLWVEAIETVSICFCMYALIRFYTHAKSLLRVRRAFTKFVCFKIIVFIRFTQAWAFSFALQYGIVTTGSRFSYNDILWGIPCLLTSIEMVLFSATFWYAYNSGDYSYESTLCLERASVLFAILDVLDPRDLLDGFRRMFGLWQHLHGNGGWKEWRAAERRTGWVGKLRALVLKLRRTDRSSMKSDHQDGVGKLQISAPIAMDIEDVR
ncbi:Transmembrane protein [Pseudocercospora fuligena]|uniref:Transmembrane protein n=1 Tax=Pseudocercospora fuligena TaxID=685502 RepID=A0A8H6RAI2_9PEZI|nr:Transmembrane protein [Pseudocercospora fuligena]